MGNIMTFSAILVCLATAVVAGPVPLSFKGPGSVVRVEFIFDNAVRQTNDLPTAALRASRRRMISGAQMGFVELRDLADAGDGLAAFRFARLMEARETPDPSGVKAHYYAIAAYTGRDFAVPPLARLLQSEGAAYSVSRLKHSLNAMTVQALSGNPVASTLLGQLYADGVPFGRDLRQAERYLYMASDGGNPRGALDLGVALMSDPDDAATGHVAARSALNLAARGEDLSIRITAENLLRLIDAKTVSNLEVTE